MTLTGLDYVAAACPVDEGAMAHHGAGAVVWIAMTRPGDEPEAPARHHGERLGVVLRRTHPMAIPQDGCAYPFWH
jgi:hypothetical protein